MTIEEPKQPNPLFTSPERSIEEKSELTKIEVGNSVKVENRKAGPFWNMTGEVVSISSDGLTAMVKFEIFGEKDTKPVEISIDYLIPNES